METKSHQEPIGFEISVSGRGDGTIEAVYILFSHAKVERTVRLRGDILLADFDRDGRLVGFEILAPIKLNWLTDSVEEPVRASFKRFVETSMPPQFLMSN